MEFNVPRVHALDAFTVGRQVMSTAKRQNGGVTSWVTKCVNRKVGGSCDQGGTHVNSRGNHMYSSERVRDSRLRFATAGQSNVMPTLAAARPPKSAANLF